MNLRMIVQIIGYILRAQAAMLLLPLAIAIAGGEGTAWAFCVTIALLLIISCASFLYKPETKSIYAREGFVIVAASWMLMSFFGALPSYFSGAIPSFIDSLFESASGMTATGATVLTDVEALPSSLLFWRSFSNWVGGMGVLVFVMAIMPLAGGRSMHIMRAEAAGPSVGKLVPKIKHTAMILYGIYILLTVILVALLRACGLPWFDSFCHAFATAGTGGFSIKNGGIAHYDGAAVQWITAVFMVLFSLNFNLYYLLLMREFKRFIKNEELVTFMGVAIVATVLVTIAIVPVTGSGVVAVREAFFQVTAVMSTTAFTTADFSLWPEVCRTLLVVLMLIGGCAGSTSGGIKMSRVIIMLRSVGSEIKRMLHPRAVSAVKLDGRPVERETVVGVHVFVCVYILICAVSMLLISIENFDFSTTVISVAACISNVGIRLGISGAANGFADFSFFSKIVLILDMLIGRLEIFPMILLFSPSVWRRSLR